MEALKGSLGERAGAALAAGCDVALHCNGKPEEMEQVAAAVGALSPEAQRRIAAARACLGRPQAVDVAALQRRLDGLLTSVRWDERCVGEECVSTCRCRWSPNH